MVAVNHETSTYKNSDYARFAKNLGSFGVKGIMLILL